MRTQGNIKFCHRSLLINANQNVILRFVVPLCGGDDTLISILEFRNTFTRRLSNGRRT